MCNIFVLDIGGFNDVLSIGGVNNVLGIGGVNNVLGIGGVNTVFGVGGFSDVFVIFLQLTDNVVHLLCEAIAPVKYYIILI